MHLKPRQLQVFKALLEAGSVSRAALILNLSQPAVSVALANLEATLGFTLFHRQRGYFAPTSDALLLNDDISQGLLALDRIERRVQQIQSGSSGAVTIATNGVLAFHLLPQLIAGFQRDSPATQFDIRIHPSRETASLVANRLVDIGLIDAPIPVAGLAGDVIPMACVCILRHDDPLAAVECVTPAHLDGRHVVGITGSLSVDRQLQHIMASANVRLQQTTTSSYFAIARNLVAAGNQVAIVDPINATAPIDDGVVWRRFEPAITHEFAIVTHGQQPLGIAAQAFRDRLFAHLCDAVELTPDKTQPESIA